jgi:hypothetical protein
VARGRRHGNVLPARQPRRFLLPMLTTLLLVPSSEARQCCVGRRLLRPFVVLMPKVGILELRPFQTSLSVSNKDLTPSPTTHIVPLNGTLLGLPRGRGYLASSHFELSAVSG